MDLDFFFHDLSQVLCGESFTFEKDASKNKKNIQPPQNLIDLIQNLGKNIKAENIGQVTLKLTPTMGRPAKEIEVLEPQELQNVEDEQREENLPETQESGEKEEPATQETAVVDDVVTDEAQEEPQPILSKDGASEEASVTPEHQTYIQVIPSYFHEPAEAWNIPRDLPNRQSKALQKSFKYFMRSFQDGENKILIFDTFAAPNTFTDQALANASLSILVTDPHVRSIKKTNQYIDFLQTQYEGSFMLCRNMVCMQEMADFRNDPLIPFCNTLAQYYLSAQYKTPFYLEALRERSQSEDPAVVIQAEEKYFALALLVLTRSCLQRLEKFSEENQKKFDQLARQFFAEDSPYFNFLNQM